MSSSAIVTFVDKLISIKKSGSSSLSIIRNFNGLVKSLCELDSFVEMDNLKLQIIQQLKLLIVHRIHCKLQVDRKMHIVFSGPPGVGKTSISKIMAKIWMQIGVLNFSSNPPKTIATPESSEMIHYVGEMIKSINSLNVISDDLMIDYCSDDNDDYKEELQKLLTATTSKWGLLKYNCETVREVCETIIQLSQVVDEIPSSCDSDDEDFGDDMYVIAGRDSFVGEYQGHTSIKTQRFLEDNIGKVIIVEEAYLLCLGSNDTFGMEALTTINRFMDENADKVIFIFNGYKDKLDETIFKMQPGLRRRVQWCFEVDGYSASGLMKIFKQQLNKRGYICSHTDEELISFFTRNKDSFTAFGGDTEKLANFCDIVYSTEFFDEMQGSGKEGDFVITPDHLKEAFRQFEDLRINDPDLDPDDAAYRRIRNAPPPFGMYL